MASQKQPQVLEIDPPAEIKFVGPFNDVVTTKLKLKNPSDKKVGFKVKTTAPRRYCVRPNSGFVDAGATVEVSVMLQPLDSDVVQDRGKHKFMVQALFSGAYEDIEKLWGDAAPSDFMDSKLRCVFEGEGANEIQTAIAQSLQTGAGNQEELRALMDECKRLQVENEKLRDFVDHAEGGGAGSLKVLTRAQKELFAGVFVLALIIGVCLGYLVL